MDFNYHVIQIQPNCHAMFLGVNGGLTYAYDRRRIFCCYSAAREAAEELIAEQKKLGIWRAGMEYELISEET